MTDDIVVTGLGAITPLGADLPATWDAMLAGRSGVSALTEGWAAQLPVRLAARLPVDPAGLLEHRLARRMDRSEQIALIAAREAWASAGAPQVDPERLGVVMGTGIGGATSLLDQDDLMEASGPRRVSPHLITMLMPNGPAAWISIDIGAKGGVRTPSSACASGAEALIMGWEMIRSGQVDVVVAGGTESCILPLTLAGFAQMKALSSRNDDPEAAARPFDVDRDGFVLGEGSAVVVLERGEFARARGAHCHAVLAGVALTSDGMDIVAGDVNGQIRAMRKALAVAGLSARDIGLVQAHATSTPKGDPVEALAINTVLDDQTPVTAIKSMTGHLLGAAGAMAGIAAVLSLRDGLIPPTRNTETLDPAVHLDVVMGQARKTTATAVLANAFGFGGHNACLVFTPADGN